MARTRSSDDSDTGSTGATHRYPRRKRTPSVQSVRAAENTQFAQALARQSARATESTVRAPRQSTRAAAAPERRAILPTHGSRTASVLNDRRGETRETRVDVADALVEDNTVARPTSRKRKKGKPFAKLCEEYGIPLPEGGVSLDRHKKKGGGYRYFRRHKTYGATQWAGLTQEQQAIIREQAACKMPQTITAAQTKWTAAAFEHHLAHDSSFVPRTSKVPFEQLLTDNDIPPPATKKKNGSFSKYKQTEFDKLTQAQQDIIRMEARSKLPLSENRRMLSNGKAADMLHAPHIDDLVNAYPREVEAPARRKDNSYGRWTLVQFHNMSEKMQSLIRKFFPYYVPPNYDSVPLTFTDPEYLTEGAIQYCRERMFQLMEHGCNGSGQYCGSCLGLFNDAAEQGQSFVVMMRAIIGHHRNRYGRHVLGGQGVYLYKMGQVERWREYQKSDMVAVCAHADRTQNLEDFVISKSRYLMSDKCIEQDMPEYENNCKKDFDSEEWRARYDRPISDHENFPPVLSRMVFPEFRMLDEEVAPEGVEEAEAARVQAEEVAAEAVRAAGAARLRADEAAARESARLEAEMLAEAGLARPPEAAPAAPVINAEAAAVAEANHVQAQAEAEEAARVYQEAMAALEIARLRMETTAAAAAEAARVREEAMAAAVPAPEPMLVEQVPAGAHGHVEMPAEEAAHVLAQGLAADIDRAREQADRQAAEALASIQASEARHEPEAV